MKCDNCTETAKYELKKPSQFYCAAHLPWFIKLHKDLGTKVFEVASAPKPVVEEEPVLEMNRAIHGSTMMETAPEEETTSEVVEEPVLEKKPIKKKA